MPVKSDSGPALVHTMPADSAVCCCDWMVVCLTNIVYNLTYLPLPIFPLPIFQTVVVFFCGYIDVAFFLMPHFSIAQFSHCPIFRCPCFSWFFPLPFLQWITSPNSHHHTTVLNTDVPNCYTMLKLLALDCSHIVILGIAVRHVVVNCAYPVCHRYVI